MRDHPDITRTTTPGAVHPVQISRDGANDRASVIPPEIADAHEFSLRTVAVGILGGAWPFQFMDSINAANQQLGNRTFLRWVGGLRAKRLDWSRETDTCVSATEDQRGAGRQLTSIAPLQLMPKKRKKKEGEMAEETAEKPAEATAEATARLGEQSELEPEATLPQVQAGAGVVAAEKKKKKKTRAQVALHTLRADGVEEFGRYIHEEISESVLLHTLTERITRAENLSDKRDAALGVVEARLRAVDPESPPAVRQAAAPGRGQVAEKAIVAPVKTALNKRETELFECCSKGNAGRFKHLLKHGPIDINMGSRFGTLLSLAAFKGCTGIVRELLGVPGIDVNLGQERSVTPLYFAAQQGHTEVVKLLLAARGINVNLVTLTDGTTPLCIAAFQGREEIVKLLLTDPNINVNAHNVRGVTPLLFAIQKGHTEIVKLLLAASGINVNKALMYATTPLCLAAQYGQEEVAKLLLAAPNINVDARLNDGATALFSAAQAGFPGIVGQLVKHGADVNLLTNEATSPLCIAAKHGHVEVVRLLLQVPGILVNQATYAWVTPLCIAAKHGHVEVVRLLLQVPGILVNQATYAWVTPLCIATRQGHGDVVRSLLRKDADPNLGTDSGLTPLHIACLRGHTAVVRMLLHAGADLEAEVTVEKTEKYTPYSLAQLGGHQGIMSMLERRRQEKVEQLPQFESLSPVDQPGTITPPTTPPPNPVPLQSTTQTAQPTAIPPEATESQATETMEPADTEPAINSPEPASQALPDSPPQATNSPLDLAKGELIQEVLKKLERDTLEPLEGIRLMVEARAVDCLDSLCGLYNRLAGIERQKERARRRGVRRREFAMEAAAMPADIPLTFYMGQKRNLDAEAVEGVIKSQLSQSYHRFVSQAVNDMEFGRGKPTKDYPGLWHASAGIPGVGSCSVFYYINEETREIRIVGIGHHAGRAAYRLDYAAEELGRSRQILRID